jgi:hypothetical protein
MSGQVLKLDDDAHKAVEALLPWFVNGSLAGGERTRVQEHLDDCARCRRDAEWLREVQSAYEATEMMPDAAASFRKLRPRLDARGPWSLSGLHAALLRYAQRTQGWARWTMAAQFGLIVTLAVILVVGDGGEKTYRVLGADTRALPGNVVVSFDPATPEAQLRRIVREAGARIASGPTQNDAYVLQIPAGQEGVALQRLRAEPAVTLAEPLQAAAAQ